MADAVAGVGRGTRMIVAFVVSCCCRFLSGGRVVDGSVGRAIWGVVAGAAVARAPAGCDVFRITAGAVVEGGVDGAMLGRGGAGGLIGVVGAGGAGLIAEDCCRG